MAKCFLTGLELDFENACILDRGGAKRALHSLKERLTAVERIVTQLSPKDEVQVFDRRSKTTKSRSQSRLVSKSVAAALSTSYPEAPLFMTWREFTNRRRALFPELRQRQAGKEGADGHGGANGVHAGPSAGVVTTVAPRPPYCFGNRIGKATSAVNMHRALWPHSGTMVTSCFAPNFSLTSLPKAWPRASRVGPWAMAEQEESKPPRGRMSISPSR